MTLRTIVKVASAGLATAAAITMQAVKPQDAPELANDVSRPRMLAMRGCDGSTSVMSLARDLMEKHGVPAVRVDSQILNPEKNVYLEEAGNNLRLSLELANEDAQAANRSLVFKALTGDHFTAVVQHQKATLKNMGMLSVLGYRKNQLDEIVCQVKNCLTSSYGHIVDKNGDKSDYCSNRMSETADQIVLDPEHIIKAIDVENALVEDARRQLHMSGFPVAEVVSEKLLGYLATNSQVDLDIAVKEWGIFLRAWGVHPEETKIVKRLQQDQGTQKAALHKDVILNSGKIHETLKEAGPSKYLHYLLDYSETEKGAKEELDEAAI